MTLIFKRGTDCPPATILEETLAGESAPAWVSHIAGCDTCGGYLNALAEEQRSFLAQRPPELFVRQVARRGAANRQPRRWWTLATGLVAAAAAVILIPTLILKSGDDVRTKGSAPFHVFYKRGASEPAALVPDTHLRAGDLLRFSYRANSDGYLAIMDLDGAGKVTPFFPFGGERSAALHAGESTLPGSVTLDTAPGPEWLVAIFSTTPFEIAPIAAQLHAHAPGLAVEVTCDGCKVETLRFEKSP